MNTKDLGSIKEFIQAGDNIATYTNAAGYNLLIGYMRFANPIEPAVVKLIVQNNNVQINHVDNFQRSALHWAALRNAPESA